IFAFSEQEYLVVTDGLPYVCTHSDLGETPFLSCRLISHDRDLNGKYAFIAYKIEAGELAVIYLHDNLPVNEKAPPHEIRAAIEAAAKTGTALDPDPAKHLRYKRKS